MLEKLYAESFFRCLVLFPIQKTRFSAGLTREHFGIAAAKDKSRNSQYHANVQLSHRNEEYEESSIFNSCESDPVLSVFGI